MTKDEARKKWCPFTKTRETIAPKNDIDELHKLKTCCLASDCMAWRWDFGHIEQGEIVHSNVNGYCGLAGK